MKAKPQGSNSMKRYRVSVVKANASKSLERSGNLSQPRTDDALKAENQIAYEISNTNSIGASLGKIGLNNTVVGMPQVKVATQSLINVVKVAARQKKTQLVKKDQPVVAADDQPTAAPLSSSAANIGTSKKQQFSLNNTQIVADHLATFKKETLFSNTIRPLNDTAPKNTLDFKDQTAHQLTLSNTALSNLKQQLAQVQSSAKHSDQKQSSLQQTQKISFTQPRNSMKSRGKPQSQKHGNKLSASSQFDWSGFLANLLQENLKPKKSTLGAGNQRSALYARPYQIQQDIQNKTQPLPKHLIERKSVGQKGDGKFAAYGYSNNYGMVYQRMESRGSDYRPRIGNKHIEIAAPFGGSSNKLAATLQANQLMIGALNLTEDKTVNVLTEVTESRDGEKDNSSISAPSTHRSRAQVSEDYKFGRMLGEGAYAVVRLAYKKSEGQNYAAKIYDKSKLVDEHRRSSVCREVMLMQKLKHKYCVDFVEAFETDHHVYVIMEYVKGKNLHDYLKKQRAEEGKTEFDQTLEEQEAKRILRQLLEVLQYLHDEGITHRDIKLENILLDTDNNVKLIDFGFSTCYKPQKKLKMFCGTPSYMAPEIVSRMEYYGPPADIWAAGVLLFCLLNGYFPFKGQTDAELYRRIQRGSFKLIRSDLSDECLSILKEFINVNQDSRLTAAELLQENWFLTDSSKKRSQAEIRRQFKAKILSKIPLRGNAKNQICIPAPQKQFEQESYNFNASNTASNMASNRTQQNIELALHRQINQASPPSSMPSSAASYQQPTQPNWRQQTQIFSHKRPYNQTSDELNQQVTQAYFNMNGRTTHNAVQGIAPPSGKFTHLPDRKDSPRMLASQDGTKVVDVDEETKEVINEINSIYSDQAIFQTDPININRTEPGENDYDFMKMKLSLRNKPEPLPRIKTNNFVEDQAESENAAGAAYGAFSVPSNKQ